MFSKTIIALGLSAASVLGAPLETYEDNAHDSFAPSNLYHYNVGTGAIECGVDSGLIDKATTNNGHDTTTLLTFTYPEEAAGKKCQFQFSLGDEASVSGSKKIDVYTSTSPAPGCTDGWGPGNQRDKHIGRLSVEVGQDATWDATYGSYLTEPTECKAPGTVEGFELVGVNDDDRVYWLARASGARIAFV